MRRPRSLSGDEAALWSRVAATVKPLAGKKRPIVSEVEPSPPNPKRRMAGGERLIPPAAPDKAVPRKAELALKHGLDSTWDRTIARGIVAPDFTIDLHGHTLDAAWSRLEHGLLLAENQGARVVLVITGKPRPVERGSGHGQRGVIRAKLIDWLAAGSHASQIAAVRGAHPRHGGAGAVYVVLRKPIRRA